MHREDANILLASGADQLRPQLSVADAAIRQIRSDLSQLLTEHEDTLPQNPAELLQTTIRRVYWNRLLRKFDTPAAAVTAIKDDKVNGETPTVFIPHNDLTALRIWQLLQEASAEIMQFKIEMLPQKIEDETATRLGRMPGLLSMAHDEKDNLLSYHVPGERFNELYGWDSYFMGLGLLEDGNTEGVRNIITHQKYQMRHFNMILNAPRPYYIRRGQPPLFPSLLRTYYEALPADEKPDSEWMQESIRAAINEYRSVWTDENHRTPTGLTRYYESAKGIPMETEEGHFDSIFHIHAHAAGMELREYQGAYLRGEIHNAELDDFFAHDRAGRASGHDTSNRLVGRAAHLNPAELNALLYKYETDIADMLEQHCDRELTGWNSETERSDEWRNAAEERKNRMTDILWDNEAGMFVDYDFKQNKQVRYGNATGFYPLWAGLATIEQADSIVRSLLPKLEQAGGLAASDEESRGKVTAQRPLRQWDYPFGWAPHQMLAWEGLEKYGYHLHAQRLIYKWLHMILSEALRYNGAIAEKYDVVTCSQDIEAEYGNVGSKVDMKIGAGFGWTNASYQKGYALLDPQYKEALCKLLPPETVFAQSE